jgi:hypothetical protein
MTYETGRHLIHETQHRSSHKHTRQLELPLLAAAEISGSGIPFTSQVTSLEKVLHRRTILSPAFELAPDPDVLEYRQVIEKHVSLRADPYD